jgi:hypothetical protein
MSGAKAPDSNRETLHQIVKRYRKAYHEILNNNQDQIPEASWSSIDWNYNWRTDDGNYAGYYSFTELRKKVHDGLELLNAIKEKDKPLQKDIQMLERIEYNSFRVLSVFEKKYEDYINSKLPKKGTKIEKLSNDKLVGEALIVEVKDRMQRPKATLDYEWNNDITIGRMILLPDLNLPLKHEMLLKKINDIGTEEIVMQTLVELDGDVTTRIQERFANDQNNVLLKIHAEAVDTSIGFWSKIADMISKIAGKAFNSMLGEK